MKTHEIVHAVQSPEADDVFYIARTTGLPMTVWVSPRGNARQDVRVKGHVTDGNQMNPANTPVVGVRPSPRSSRAASRRMTRGQFLNGSR